MRETGLLPNVLFWIFPQIYAPAFPIYLQLCPRHVLANFSVSILFQTPLQCYYLESVTIWISSPILHLLSLPWVLLLCLAVIFIALFHSVPLLLPRTLSCLCLSLGSSITEFKLTFLSQVSYFESAHTLQRLPCLWLRPLPVLSFSPKLLVFPPDIP